MSVIPLYLQRRFEQRWAAKLALLVPSAVPKGIRLKRAAKTSARQTKVKERPTGLKQRA
jgi:hypothetical protein